MVSLPGSVRWARPNSARHSGRIPGADRATHNGHQGRLRRIPSRRNARRSLASNQGHRSAPGQTRCAMETKAMMSLSRAIFVAALLLGASAMAQSPKPNPPPPGTPAATQPKPPPPATAQPKPAPPAAGAQPPAPATPGASPPAGDKPDFKPEEIEQLVASIALYPDSLISQILMASTYPVEIVACDRWVKANPKLKDDALAKELEKQPWDASVKSLVAFPQVLSMMSENLDTTVKIGDAFIGQQK